MLRAVAAAGYTSPTPVQAGVIPLVRQGKDIIGQARTGTGKTAAFVIPIWESLLDVERTVHPRSIVLVPTRELAAQVEGEFAKLAPRPHLKTATIVGGESFRNQHRALVKGVHTVVGTPGRVIDHLERGTLDVTKIGIVVLDEADRMLDIGFRPAIERILRVIPRARQTLLLSATVPPPILRLAQRYMIEPERLDFSAGSVTVSTIEQFYFNVPQDQKFELLLRLLDREKPDQAIIFCRTRRRTEDVRRRLAKTVPEVAAMHGDMRQSDRNRTMEGFRANKIRYLVATDVVGRGIDVTSVSHIINFDLPDDCDDYVHRVGRTGRMGREGVSFTFATPDQGEALTRIEMRIDRLLQPDSLDLPSRPAHGVTKRPHPGHEELHPATKAPAAPPPPPGRRPVRRYRRGL